MHAVSSSAVHFRIDGLHHRKSQFRLAMAVFESGSLLRKKGDVIALLITPTRGPPAIDSKSA